MNESKLNTLINTLLPEDVINKCAVDHTIKCNFITTSNIKIESESTKISQIKSFEVSKCVVCISGIYLPIYNKDNIKHLNIVEVESTRNNLRKIALGIASNKAIFLQGPVGCGKTISVEYLAARTGLLLGENFIKIQLGDQTDSKMLLGTYRCTDIPGEFIWSPGVLTQVCIQKKR